MLDQLFKGSDGFAWDVRASAFLVMFLLFISNLIMFPNPPPDHGRRATSLNMLGIVALVSGGLIFAIFGLTNVGEVVVSSLLYGFFSGACEYLYCTRLFAELALWYTR